MSGIPVLRMWANRFLAFLAGTAAALVVYCVFLVRHAEVVSRHIEGLEGGAKLVLAGLLFGIALASGTLTAAIKPRTLGGAFAIGLAIPAVIFAADIRFGGSTAPAGEAAASGSFGEGASLILSPVGTVARLERATVEKEKADLEAALGQSEREKQQILDRADRLNSERKGATEERDELEASEGKLRTERDQAKGEATRLRDELTIAKAMVDELEKQLRRRPPAVAMRLTVSADPETVPAGGSTRILVTARNESGEAVSGVEVKLEASAGSFAGAASGTTDAAGTFRVQWITGPAGEYEVDATHAITVEISKPGHVPERAELTIRVKAPLPPKQPEPAPPVEPTGLKPVAPPTRPDPVKPVPPTEPERPPVPGAMVVQATARPGIVAAGGSTTIRIFVRTPAGEPVAGAAVSLGTTGGTFENARGGRTTGVTDSEGNFRVSWRTMPAEVYTSDVPYEFRADVTKEGFVEARAKVAVRVTATARRAIPLLIFARADRTRLTAGGSATITVTAKTATGRPIPGATVNIGALDGTFEGTNEGTATGVTDEKGSFQIVWRTRPAAEYLEDKPFDLTVEVTKPGHALARTQIRMEVRPKRR